MVSIIIPTVNRHQSLVKLVESIENQNLSRENFEILIVYNFAATKNSPQIFQSTAAHIKVLRAPFPGVNHARNCGLLAARGDILLFVDDDCLMENPNFLKNLVARHRLQPQTLSIGGPYSLSAWSSFWDRAYFANMNLWLEQQKVTETTSRALLGGNASYKASIFEGGLRFTPGIKYGGSETPLNERIFEDFGPHGFFDDLALTHQSQLSFKNFIYKAYMQGRGYADQSKRAAPNISNSLDLTSVSSRSLRAALHLYAFVFMVGFRSSIHERRFIWRSLLEEIAVRAKKPLLQIYLNIHYSLKFLGAKNKWWN